MNGNTATGHDLALGLTGPGFAHARAMSVARALVTTDHAASGPWHDYVLDVSRPLDATPQWRRIGAAWLQAIVLVEVVGVAIVLLGVPLALAARGIVEVVALLGRSLVP